MGTIGRQISSHSAFYFRSFSLHLSLESTALPEEFNGTLSTRCGSNGSSLSAIIESPTSHWELSAPGPNREFRTVRSSSAPTRRLRPAYVVGAILCGTGILCNEWVLTRLFSADGTLEFETRAQIWFFDIGLVLLGLFLVWYSRWSSSLAALRHCQRNYPKTTASVFGFGLVLLFIGSLEVFFHALNQFKADHSKVQESALRFVRTEPLGYKNPPNARAVERMSLSGREIFNVTYTTDSHSRRVTPFRNTRQARKFILFFGCSFTFGQGVEDEETLPFFVGQLAPDYEPYNYGVIGYGPQQVLIKLEDTTLRREIEQDEGILIYTFIHDHVYRVIGTINHHGRERPYYVLDANGDLQRKGDMVSGRPGIALWYWLVGKSQTAQYFQLGFNWRITEDDIRLTARIIVEAHNAFSSMFNHSKFYVLMYPNPASHSRKELIPLFEAAGVKVIDYSELFDPSDPAFRIEGDPHPTPKAYQMVAAKLTRDLGICKVNGTSLLEQPSQEAYTPDFSSPHFSAPVSIPVGAQ